MTDAPNQDLPDELDDLEPNQDLPEPGYPTNPDGSPLDEDLAPNQDLPSEKQPPRGKGNNRGKSDQAPGKNKP